MLSNTRNPDAWCPPSIDTFFFTDDDDDDALSPIYISYFYLETHSRLIAG